MWVWQIIVYCPNHDWECRGDHWSPMRYNSLYLPKSDANSIHSAAGQRLAAPYIKNPTDQSAEQYHVGRALRMMDDHRTEGSNYRRALPAKSASRGRAGGRLGRCVARGGDLPVLILREAGCRKQGGSVEPANKSIPYRQIRILQIHNKTFPIFGGFSVDSCAIIIKLRKYARYQFFI